MAKPTQMTNVSAVPFFSEGAVAATRAENCGESAATVIPQIIRKITKNKLPETIIQGEIKQQKQEVARE